MELNYTLLITTVSHRAHLLKDSLTSFMKRVDHLPKFIMVHEDYRPPHERMIGVPCDKKATKLILDDIQREFNVGILHKFTDPWVGLGKAVHFLTQHTDSFPEWKYCFYMQEDHNILHYIQAKRILELMERYELNQVRLNKKINFPVAPSGFRHEKVELDGQAFLASEHWHFQGGFCRRELLRNSIAAIVQDAGDNVVEWTARKFNDHINREVFGLRKEDYPWSPQERIDKAKTLIWGDLGEPAYLEHTGWDMPAQDHSPGRDWPTTTREKTR